MAKMIGYLKKIARIDTTNKTQASTPSPPSDQQQQQQQQSHSKQQPQRVEKSGSSPVPRITLMEAQSTSKPTDSGQTSITATATVAAYNTWERTYHYHEDEMMMRPSTSSSNNIRPPSMMITSMPCEEDEDDDDEGHEPEDDELGAATTTTSTTTIERMKRRRGRHLLPSPFRNLLPPVSPARARTNSGSSRSSSSGFKSTVSGEEGGPLGAGSSTATHSAASSRHSTSSSGKVSRKTKSTSSRSSSTICGDKENTCPRHVATDPSPTTLCPTIASALWKPLWPPGWHPRSSSTAATAAAAAAAAAGASSSSSTSQPSVTSGTDQGRAKCEVAGAGVGGNVAAAVSDLTATSKSSEHMRMGGSSYHHHHHHHHQHYQHHHQPQSQFTKMTSESSLSAAASSQPPPPPPTAQRRTGNLKQPQYSSMHPHHHHHHPLSHQPPQHQQQQQPSRLNGGVGAGGDSVDHSMTPASSSQSNSCVCFAIFNEDDYEKVEDWLDEHPGFVQSYFLRKASRTLIDSWMLAHASSLATSGTLCANPALASGDNSGANTPVRKISAHEFEASGGGYLRPMVSTTCDGTPTFLQLTESENETCGAAAGGGGNSPTTGKISLLTPGATTTTSQLAQSSQSFSVTTAAGDLAEAGGQTKSPSASMGSSCELKQQVPSNVASSNSLLGSMQQQQPSQQQPQPLPLGTIGRHRASIMSIKSREELKAITDEKDLVFELLKDICNELDVRQLCHKILKNVSILTDADRCSLFLVKGEKNDPNNSRYLVSQLFDVSGQSTMEQMASKEEITIPWGTGIVGYVADSGEAVNIPDCYRDARFSSMVDEKTGYTTVNMLCNPIFDCHGEVVGVAQVINKNNAECFGTNDQQVFTHYLQFAGIGIGNAQLYERSQLENKRNQVLLDLARMVFEKQSNIENIIYRILIHILSLLQCERAQILLLADEPNDADFYYYGRTYQDPYVYFNLVPSSQIAAHSGSDGEAGGGGGVGGVGGGGEAHQHECSSNASTTSIESTASSSVPLSELIAVEARPLGGRKSRTASGTNIVSVGSFSRVFDMEATDLSRADLERNNAQTPFEGRFPVNIGVTGYVATTGETLNIPDAYHDGRFDPVVDANAPNGFRHRSILCMPIRNATRRIIGVAQLINKLNGRPFNKNDENLFEAFAIFSGMGIENTQMFERAVKAMAKQKVTLELLSYHASASAQEATRFAKRYIPSAGAFNLSSLCFDDFALNEEEMLTAVIRMFIDLDFIERFQIDYKVLCKWILSVKKNYRPVLYHNWRHAFNVAQMMYAIFVNTDICMQLGELDTLALIVACLCHDLDHRGTNNSYHVKTGSPLAQLYSTSTLEHHHFDQSLMILNSEGNQILHNLSPEEYRAVVNVMEEAILSTDLAVYFQKRSNFFHLIDTNEYDWRENREHRSLLRSMLMTCCDIAAITKPWEIEKVVAELVASEFFKQGDIEREQLNIEPIDMMNRNKKEELPKMQISFIDSICLPIYQAFAKLCKHKLDVLLRGVYRNREAWSLLSNEPYELSIVSPIANVTAFQVHTADEATETTDTSAPAEDEGEASMNVEAID